MILAVPEMIRIFGGLEGYQHKVRLLICLRSGPKPGETVCRRKTLFVLPIRHVSCSYLSREERLPNRCREDAFERYQRIQFIFVCF